MNALFLKDLRLKVKRGLERRVREGRSGGGMAYGYRNSATPDSNAANRASRSYQRPRVNTQARLRCGRRKRPSPGGQCVVLLSVRCITYG